ELLLHVDDAVLVDPVVAPLAVGVDVVGVAGARHVHERRELVALHSGALLAVLLRQPRLPDVRRFHHVVVDADDLREVHSQQRIRPRFWNTVARWRPPHVRIPASRSSTATGTSSSRATCSSASSRQSSRTGRSRSSGTTRRRKRTSSSRTSTSRRASA